MAHSTGKNRMISWKQALVVMGLNLLFSGAVSAQEAAVQGYQVLRTPQATKAPSDKVEVIEFFSYSSRPCFALELMLNDWLAKQGGSIVFRRIPVPVRTRRPEQALYYTFEGMRKVPELHLKLFDAIYVQKQRLQTEDEIFAFLKAQGLDISKFSELYNSFTVQRNVTHATEVVEAYRVDSVPALVVDGRFMTSFSIVESTSAPGTTGDALPERTLQVVRDLVAKVSAERLAQ
jgi:thiol:disulfide interchange protein DsbA